ncbi:MAG: response regulator [Bacteroidota bacterium]
MKSLKFVLAVDDERANNLLIQILLHEEIGLQCEFQSATTVGRALQLLDNLHTSQQAFPDLILLDVNMPGKGGFDFLELYQEKGFDDQYDCSVIMFSSSISPQITEHAQQYSFVVALEEKSLDSDDLQQVIRKFFRLD